MPSSTRSKYLFVLSAIGSIIFDFNECLYDFYNLLEIIIPKKHRITIHNGIIHPNEGLSFPLMISIMGSIKSIYGM